MDRCTLIQSASFNGSGGRNPAPPSPSAGSRRPALPASEDDSAAPERTALLRHPSTGGTARSSRGSSNRRVQWKDRHGKKLTEVKEFQPSDSSDSDDEYQDTCICAIM